MSPALPTIGPAREYLVFNQTIKSIVDTSYSDLDRYETVFSPAKLSIEEIIGGLNTIQQQTESINRHFINTLQSLRNIRNNTIYLVISTGRSGTNALAKLLQKFSAMLAMHHFPAPVASSITTEYFIRMIMNKFEKEVDPYRCQGTFSYYSDIYLRNRIVEVMHSINKKVVFINHWESWWTPIMKKFFPNSKILILERKIEDTIYSHIATNVREADNIYAQSRKTSPNFNSMGMNISLPDVVLDKRDNTFGFQVSDLELMDQVFIVDSTLRKFSRAMERILPDDQCCRISADLLFLRNGDEIRRLLEFFDLYTENKAKMTHDHYLIKHNTKNRQLRFSDSDIQKTKEEINIRMPRYFSEYG
jgi:hypothetical protein